MNLYRVTLSYACFGILVWAGRVQDAAPIGRWMVGKTVDEVERWVTSKGGSIELLTAQID